MLGTRFFLAVKWAVDLSRNVDDGVDTLHLQCLAAHAQPLCKNKPRTSPLVCPHLHNGGLG